MATINTFKHVEDVISISAGHLIFKEGQPGDFMYIVKEGEVNILVNNRVMETVGPGGLIGEMALIEPGCRSATAVAKSDCKLIAIDEAGFKTYIHHTPFFAIQVMRVMSNRLRQMNGLV